MRKFRLLYLAPAFALIALVCWALASPPGSSPDDDFHLASIWCATSNPVDCKPSTTADSRLVPPTVYYAACYAYQPDVSAACQAKHSESSVPSKRTTRGSFQNNYPPVYYATMSLLVTPNFELSVFLMRLLNILLLIGLTVGLWLLLPVRRRLALIGGWVLTVVPLGLFLIGSNNPSSWALIGVGSSWLALLGFFETVGRRKIFLGALFAISVVMAAGSRGDAALYTVLGSAVVLVLSFERSRRFLLHCILPAALGIVALVFFLSSRQSNVATQGLSDGTEISGKVSVFALIFKDLINVPTLWTGSFGTWDLGWLDVDLPYIVPFGALLALALTIPFALRHRFARKTIALVAIGTVLWLLPTYVLVAGGDQIPQNVQPRYLLPLIVLGVGVTLLGAVGDRVTWSRATLIAVVAALAIADAIAMYVNMRRYIFGVSSHEFNLNSGIQWWWHMPIPPMVMLTLGCLSWIALLVTFAREANRGRTADNIREVHPARGDH